MALDALLNPLVSGALVLSGVGLGFLISRNIARRQRHHEAKQRAYERLLPQIREAISILGAMHTVTSAEFGDDEMFVGNITTLLGQMLYFGGREGWETMYEIDAIVEEDGEEDSEETPESKREFLDNIRELVLKVLIFRLWTTFREFSRQREVLSFAVPALTVERKLNEIESMFSSDWMGYGLRHLLSQMGLKGVFPDVDLKLRAEAFREALSELKGVMEEDLKKTL
jgi:hypothetical protein